MKNSVLLALTVVVMDLIAVISVVKASADPNEAKYKAAVSAGQEYEAEDLCGKAINEYNIAVSLKDSAEIRLKVADLYEKGYENGEFASAAGMVNTLEETISKYPTDPKGYDKLISYYDTHENYNKCAEYIRLAKENKVESDTVKSVYDKIRFMYNLKPVGYEKVESAGSCQIATRPVTVDEEQYDEKGEYIYETDENGDTYIKTIPREYTEYTFYYYDGTVKGPMNAIDMSVPIQVDFGNEETHTLYFIKKYGNDILLGERSDRIYSSVVSDNVRQFYVGTENEYTSVGSFESGVITLLNSKTGKYELLLSSGKEFMKDLDKAGSFANFVVCVEKDGSKQIYNKKGEKLFKKEIDDVILAQRGKCSYYQRGFVKFKGDADYTMVDFNSNSEMKFTCSSADLFMGELAAFEQNGKWGFVKYDGTVVIEPKYDEAKSFSNGYAAVKQNGKWGFINQEQEMIVEPQFDEALYFDNAGKAFVRSNEDGWQTIELFYYE